ncbi:hypothetical protein GH714_001859 [Hevea brasiliensis]|uniref:Uncharacterized protein n=1 Tax=Hevea brasiliensis TaxID=3981 RepID=A0A6A6KXZ4_HEVBR|nr:hypothetical protein GH714_001859 [Hevea brasiliensis]
MASCWLLQLVNHVYFSPDGQWVASASFDSWSDDNRLVSSGSKDSTLKEYCLGYKDTEVKTIPSSHADERFLPRPVCC